MKTGIIFLFVAVMLFSTVALAGEGDKAHIMKYLLEPCVNSVYFGGWLIDEVGDDFDTLDEEGIQKQIAGIYEVSRSVLQKVDVDQLISVYRENRTCGAVIQEIQRQFPEWAPC